MFEKLLKTYQKPCASANGMACSATFIIILQMHKNLARALVISLLSFPTNNGDLVGQTPFKVAPYSFMTVRALMMRAVVICARSHKIVGVS